MTIQAAEKDGKCSMTMRCMDPNSESWFQELGDFLTPDDATGDASMDAYPLPELPSLGTTASPPRAPAPTPAPVDENLPYVPGRDGVLRDWKAIWRSIRPRVDEGMSSAKISRWLHQCRPSQYRAKQTIAKIIKAGDAGLLD